MKPFGESLLDSDDDDIRAYVVNSGLLSEFNLRADFVSDANLLTMERLFVNLMCAIDENEETERSLKENESHKAAKRRSYKAEKGKRVLSQYSF